MYANFEHYKTFYYVAKYQNFTRAANALLTSQPSVTCCIQNLESTLGCKLFIRSSKGVKMTKEGELLYSYIAPSCENIAEGEQALREALGMKNKSVSIGATHMAMTYFLLPRLQKFQEKYPHAHLKICSSTTLQTRKIFRQGKLIWAIVTTPFSISDDLDNIVVKEFSSMPVAGEKFKEFKGRPVGLEELVSCPLIASSQNTTTYTFYQEYFQKNGLVLKPDIEVATIDLIIPLAEKNLGIGFAPECFAEDAISQGRVFGIELKQPIPKRQICIVTDKHRPMGLEVKQLCDMLQNLED